MKSLGPKALASGCYKTGRNARARASPQNMTQRRCTAPNIYSYRLIALRKVYRREALSSPEEMLSNLSVFSRLDCASLKRLVNKLNKP